MEKELLIVCLDSDQNTRDYVENHRSNKLQVRLVVIESEKSLTLGEIRNQAIKVARGEYICVWDDDDFYHDQRLERSIAAIVETGKRGVVLSNVIIHDATRKYSYMSVTRSWEQTLVFEREYLIANKLEYGALNQGEDTALIAKIFNDVYVLSDPVLYIYNFHLANTCDAKHFEAHFKVGQRLSSTQEACVNELLYARISSEELNSDQLDSKEFMQTLPLVGKDNLVPWGARPFCFYPKLIYR